MKIVVTGAAGNLGPVVSDALEAAGHAVTRTDVRHSKRSSADMVVADLAEPGAIDPLLAGCDALVHLGNHANDRAHAAGSPKRVSIDNVTMNMLAFDAAVAAGVKQIIFASSIQAITGRSCTRADGEPSSVPYLPADGGYPASPLWYYGLSKTAGEDLLKLLCRENPELSCVAIRFPFMTDDVSQIVALQERVRERQRQRALEAMDGRPEGEGRRRHHGRNLNELGSYLLYDDAATLIEAAIRHRPIGYHQFFPAADDAMTGRSAAELIEERYPDVPLRKPIEQITSLIDNGPITELLGWRPTPLAAATGELCGCAGATPGSGASPNAAAGRGTPGRPGCTPAQPPSQTS